jgi:hypothetical protein
VLAVRMLVAKLAWLDGALYWRDGRIAWVFPEGELAPGPSDLARAQRSLHKLRLYPLAGPQALGDAEGWIRTRQQRLELAKQLATLSVPDLKAVSEAARAGNAAALEKLTTLLPAEALCLNGLPLSPAEVLLAGRERSEPGVRRQAEDVAAPLAGRALAMLTLGALHRKLERGAFAPGSSGSEWLERAYRWGRTLGLPEEPGLVTALLVAPDGTKLTHRMLAVTDRVPPFHLEPTLLRELLAGGTPAAVVVELAEAVRDAAPVAKRYLAIRQLLPEALHERRQLAATLRRQRQEWVHAFGELLQVYARSGDPTTVRLVTAFTLLMLGHSLHTAPLVTEIHRVLREVLELPCTLQRDCLELFTEEHVRLWPGTARPGNPPRQEADALKNWLDQQWSHHGARIKRLLTATEDPAFVRDVLRLGYHSPFACLHLPGLDYYHYIFAVVRELDLSPENCNFWRLSNVLRIFPSATAAREALQPLVQAASAAPPPLRGEFFDELVTRLPYARKQVRERVARLARCVPVLLSFSLAEGAWEICHEAIAAAGALAEYAPQRSETWLTALLTALPPWLRAQPALANHLDGLGGYVHLGLALAEGDQALFLTVVQAALARPPQQSRDSLASGLEALPRFPGLRAALAQVFPRQPHRCVNLIVRLGLAAQLGAEVLAPLQALEAPTNIPTTDPAWSELLRLAPELEPLASTFLGAQALLARPPAPPPGVLQALALPQKLAGELAHLELRAVSGPTNPGITARIGNLRARLQDTAGLEAVVRTEIRERLAETTSEAQIAAAEQQVLACYRARLEQVAGPLSEELALSEDWLNAALLSTSISENRHLLKRLLRACATGDRRWREQHPENVRFLHSLAERGGDAETWQQAYPRRYRCPEVPGRIVRLRFEGDPLHILQMGNYFDTCLSFDGCNNYSTVANACELNKRVLYARDAAGRVIARKLIGINENGQLIGYETYTNLSGESALAVRRVVRHYVGEFALRCRLSLANEGAVPRLFAERWYDDGHCRWDDEDEPLAHPRGPSARPVMDQGRELAGKRASGREIGNN